jgi:hypothetical protein
VGEKVEAGCLVLGNILVLLFLLLVGLANLREFDFTLFMGLLLLYILASLVILLLSSGIGGIVHLLSHRKHAQV